MALQQHQNLTEVISQCYTDVSVPYHNTHYLIEHSVNSISSSSLSTLSHLELCQLISSRTVNLSHVALSTLSHIALDLSRTLSTLSHLRLCQLYLIYHCQLYLIQLSQLYLIQLSVNYISSVNSISSHLPSTLPLLSHVFVRLLYGRKNSNVPLCTVMCIDIIEFSLIQVILILNDLAWRCSENYN